MHVHPCGQNTKEGPFGTYVYTPPIERYGGGEPAVTGGSLPKYCMCIIYLYSSSTEGFWHVCTLVRRLWWRPVASSHWRGAVWHVCIFLP
jgi:hypothetical protein